MPGERFSYPEYTELIWRIRKALITIDLVWLILELLIFHSVQPPFLFCFFFFQFNADPATNFYTLHQSLHNGSKCYRNNIFHNQWLIYIRKHPLCKSNRPTLLWWMLCCWPLEMHGGKYNLFFVLAPKATKGRELLNEFGEIFSMINHTVINGEKFETYFNKDFFFHLWMLT